MAVLSGFWQKNGLGPLGVKVRGLQSTHLRDEFGEVTLFETFFSKFSFKDK